MEKLRRAAWTSGTSICAQPRLWGRITLLELWTGLRMGGWWPATTAPGLGFLQSSCLVGIIWTWSQELRRNSKQIQRPSWFLASSFITNGHAVKTSGKTKDRTGLQHSLLCSCPSQLHGLLVVFHPLQACLTLWAYFFNCKIRSLGISFSQVVVKLKSVNIHKKLKIVCLKYLVMTQLKKKNGMSGRCSPSLASCQIRSVSSTNLFDQRSEMCLETITGHYLCLWVLWSVSVLGNRTFKECFSQLLLVGIISHIALWLRRRILSSLF